MRMLDCSGKRSTGTRVGQLVCSGDSLCVGFFGSGARENMDEDRMVGMEWESSSWTPGDEDTIARFYSRGASRLLAYLGVGLALFGGGTSIVPFASASLPLIGRHDCGVFGCVLWREVDVVLERRKLGDLRLGCVK